jgi:CubicO group peptidase (beta-lactamase class C family)
LIDNAQALQAELNRRELLRLGALAGLGTAFVPRLAWAADQPNLSPQVTALIERWVGPGRFPGMVAALGLPGRPTQYIARGSESFTDPDQQGPDSLFRIYSMTKPITGMAAMLLIGEGQLRLDQPLADILPSYARMAVQKTYDGSITDLVPAQSPITIRELITHTSGLGYPITQRGPIQAAFLQAGLVPGQISRMIVPGLDWGRAAPSLAIFADRLAELPLVYQPGTHWSYSSGLDLMGRVIEVVSGKPFDVFLKERLFDPLGMASTFFQVPASETRRLTTNFGAVGTSLFPIDPGQTSIFLDKPPFPLGGAGLVSSPRDYDRFLRLLAGLGTFEGRPIIREAAVRLGTGDLLQPGVLRSAMLGPNCGFGAGGRVGFGPEQGLFGWSGAAGTVATIDMKRGIRSGIYVQFMPSEANSLLGEYQQALHADVMALVEKHG